MKEFILLNSELFAALGTAILAGVVRAIEKRNLKKKK
jgi:hypothetical protein